MFVKFIFVIIFFSNFYVMEADQYVVPPLVLEKGLNCACTYNGIWHRGIIKTVKPDLQVTVGNKNSNNLINCAWYGN